MKYVAIFLRKFGEYDKKTKSAIEGKIKTSKSEKRPNYVKVGEKSFKATDEFITFQKDSTYPVQLEAYSYQSNNVLLYYYDYDEMNLIGLDVLLKYGMKPKDLNKITGKKIVEQIVAGAKNVQGNPLIYIILPIACTIGGLILGYWMGGGFNATTA